MRRSLFIFPPISKTISGAAALALLLALSTACELDGASKKRAEAARNNAPGGTAPRTSLPMPPARTAQQTNAQGAGGWTYLDGRRGSIESLRGQAIVLDFYATYCPPCREEIPHLVNLQKRFGAQGLQVIGLNVGGAEDQAKVADYVRELDIQYQLGNPDDSTVDALLAGESAIPQTFVFDRQGRLVRRFIGFDEAVAAQLEEAVATALATRVAAAGE
jgi:cytochrome c biogenesis protein CcmG/thiol:disulfide interchange protein DsbE